MKKLGDKVLQFAGFWAVNIVFLWLASLVWPSHVVFGNAAISPVLGIIWTAFLLTSAMYAVNPVLSQLKIKVTKEAYMGLIYLVVNVVALWALARWLGSLTGFGIGAFWVAIVLGVIVNFIQWGFWKLVARKATQKTT